MKKVTILAVACALTLLCCLEAGAVIHVGENGCIDLKVWACKRGPNNSKVPVGWDATTNTETNVITGTYDSQLQAGVFWCGLSADVDPGNHHFGDLFRYGVEITYTKVGQSSVRRLYFNDTYSFTAAGGNIFVGPASFTNDSDGERDEYVNGGTPFVVSSSTVGTLHVRVWGRDCPCDISQFFNVVYCPQGQREVHIYTKDINGPSTVFDWGESVSIVLEYNSNLWLSGVQKSITKAGAGVWLTFTSRVDDPGSFRENYCNENDSYGYSTDSCVFTCNHD